MPWWVQKPLRAVMPDSVIKWLDGGEAKNPDGPEEPEEAPEPPTSAKARQNRDRAKERGKRLTKSDGDLEQMSTVDLRNLRDEHGTDWANQDYDRIQKVIDNRMNGKSYDKKKKKDEPKDALETAIGKYEDMFADFKGPKGGAMSIDWNRATQFDKPKKPRLPAEGTPKHLNTDQPERFADGGPVKGGTGILDDIPAMLKGGEFVMSKESVDLQGESFFDGLNKANAEDRGVSQSRDSVRDGVNTEILAQLKQKNEFQKTRIQQQAKSDNMRQQQLDTTKQLLVKEPAPNVTSVSNSNINMSSGGSIRGMREMANLGSHRR